MEQSSAAALYAVESNSPEAIVVLLVVMGLIVAIVGSLALLMKRNESFIADLNISSDK